MFDWNEYLVLAEKLSESEEEGAKRSAVSRAYYATFHNAKNYLIRKEFSYTEKHSPHYAVWNAFGLLGREEKKISLKGDRLKQKRHQVDYDNEIQNINVLTRVALQEAKDINELLKKIQQ